MLGVAVMVMGPLSPDVSLTSTCTTVPEVAALVTDTPPPPLEVEVLELLEQPATATTSTIARTAGMSRIRAM